MGRSGYHSRAILNNWQWWLWIEPWQKSGRLAKFEDGASGAEGSRWRLGSEAMYYIPPSMRIYADDHAEVVVSFMPFSRGKDLLR